MSFLQNAFSTYSLKYVGGDLKKFPEFMPVFSLFDILEISLVIRISRTTSNSKDRMSQLF